MKWLVRYTWINTTSKMKCYEDKYYKTKKETLAAMENNYIAHCGKVTVCEFVKIEKDKQIVQTIPRRYL